MMAAGHDHRHLRETLGQPIPQCRAYHVFRGEMPRIDQVQPLGLGIQKVILLYI